ncbi:MAG: hypothetical protein RSA49_00185 [Anaerovoracaceae bacterium]
MAELSPGDVDKKQRGGIIHCPENYAFLDDRYDQDDVEEICNSELPMFEKCTKCWDLDYIEDEEELAPEPVEPKTQKILDSGNRREFDSGAVRDVAEGKGRFDLVPLHELGLLLENNSVMHISKFKETADISDLHLAVRAFVADCKTDISQL